MLGKRIINTGADACTTDTTQILDAGTTQSVALYRFEDNANDTSNSTGKFGKGAVFNGSNSQISTSGFASLSQVGVSMWVNMPDVSQQAGLIARYDTNREFAIYMYSGTLTASIYYNGNNGNATSITASSYMSNDTWHHIAYTANGSTAPKLYIDGSEVGTPQYTDSAKCAYYSSSENLDIGHFAGVASYNYEGKIDQVRVFDTALSASDVTTLYNETTSTVNTLQVLGGTSCVAAYTFEGNANDLSTNYNGTASNVIYAYNGTASNVTYTTGKFGKAAVFNGSNTVIDIENMRTVMNNNFAVSLWVKTPSTFASSGYPAILSMYGYTGSGSAYGWDIEYNNSNKITFYWVSSYGVGNYILSSSLSTDTWYHVVAQKDSSSANLYINGQLDNDSTYGSAYGMYYNNFNRMTIGAKRLNYGSTSGHISGMVDQIRLFTKQLNAGEISTLYNETATSAALATIDNPSTIAYYKMADATDETGSYNGTPTNVDFNVEGKYGFAGKFNGTSSKIDLPTGDLGIGTNNFSISLWFNSADITQNDQSLWWFQHYQSPIRAGGIVSSSSSGMGGDYDLRFYCMVGGASYNANTNSDILSSNTWYHAVFVKSSTSGMTIYINGSSVATNTSATGDVNTNMSSGGANTIGYYKTTASSLYFNGRIDQFRTFNKAISASEVTTLYNEIQCPNTINTPESYFDTKLWTGDGNARSITGIGFDPDFVWIKKRANDTKSHRLFDSIRGANNVIYSDLTNQAATPTNELTAFVSGGFSLGNASAVNDAASDTYVSWNWKAASSNTTNNDGTRQSTVRASQESGFSIATYTGDGSAGATVGHNLNKIPSMVITKGTSGSAGATNWNVYTSATGPTKKLVLNTNAAEATNTTYWNNTAPTSTVFSLGTTGDSNYNGSNYVAYCFANVDGYQRIGSYIGNGSANGPFIYTGFEPAWIMIKRTDAAGAWNIFDNKRNSANPRNSILQADVADQEYTNVLYNYNFYTNGFQSLNSNNDWNASGGSYIFIAIAANPDTTAPTKANSFKTKIYTGTGSTHAITGLGFKPDFIWTKNRDTTDSSALVDSVRGIVSPAPYLASDATSANATSANMPTSVQADGYTITGAGGRTNTSGEDYVSWNWKAADHDRNLATINNDGSITSLVSANPAAGFSVVKWTGTGVDGTKIGHGLEGSPEIIITKGLSNATSWVVGVGGISGLSVNDYFTFTSYAKANSSTFYQAYSTNTFQVGVSAANEMNKSSSNQYISYCFRTIAGHSKAGKYTGTGVSGLEITLDFSPSFLLVKGAGATGWIIIDNQRPTPGGNYELYPNLSNTEDTSATSFLLGTNKFTVNSTGTWHNTNGTDYIYLAIK